jgi:hypothetical protein
MMGDEVIKTAATYGWEAGCLAFVLVTVIGSCGIVARWFMNAINKQSQLSAEREAALGLRLSTVEGFIHEKFMDLSSKNITALSDSARALETSARVISVTSNTLSYFADAIVTRKCLADVDIRRQDPNDSVIIGSRPELV